MPSCAPVDRVPEARDDRRLAGRDRASGAASTRPGCAESANPWLPSCRLLPPLQGWVRSSAWGLALLVEQEHHGAGRRIMEAFLTLCERAIDHYRASICRTDRGSADLKSDRAITRSGRNLLPHRDPVIRSGSRATTSSAVATRSLAAPHFYGR